MARSFKFADNPPEEEERLDDTSESTDLSSPDVPPTLLLSISDIPLPSAVFLVTQGGQFST